jgi:hypothetical protein
LAFSYWFNKPWFLTKGKLLLCSSYLPLGVSNWSVIYISTGAISNQHQESFPYELDKIHPKMLQRNGVVMMVMKVLVVMVMMMMIPMKPSSMTVMMAMISFLREGISPADFCLPESFLSLSVFSPVEAAESFCDPPPVLGFWGDNIREEAMAEVGQGGHTTWRCGLGLARTRGRCGPLVAHLALSFWLLLDK